MIERIEAIDAWVREWARRYSYEDGEDAYQNVLERLMHRMRDGPISLPASEDGLKGYMVNAVKKAMGSIFRHEKRALNNLMLLHDGDFVHNHPRPTCSKGHAMTPENVYAVKGKRGVGRGCRTCRNARVRQRYDAKKTLGI